MFFPHVHLRLLALLLFYVASRPSLGLALALALILGALQDSFATTPFGLHLGAALVLVAVARFFRQRLLWQRLGSQVVASLVALILQEVFMLVSTMTLGYEGFSAGDLLAHHADGDSGHRGPGTADVSPGAGHGKFSAPLRLAAPAANLRPYQPFSNLRPASHAGPGKREPLGF